MEKIENGQQWLRQGLGLFLALSLLLALLVLGTQAGYTQGSPPPAGDTLIQAARPGETIDCDHPPTGRKAKLFADNEIAVVFRADKHKNLELFTMDNSGKNLVWDDNWFFTGWAAQTDIRWPAITTADLDDDGKREMVMAFRDKEKRIAAGTPQESGDHAVLETYWYSLEGPNIGGNVEWIDVTAGNLDGHYRHDTREEVAIAFADDNHALRVLTMNGPQMEVPGALDGLYGDDSANGRGSVKYVAIATGDMDGDGYDNEIITTFRDGNKHLQCLILRRPEKTGTLEVLWSKVWTNYNRDDVAADYGNYGNVRPMDVTVGDIDGDKEDEVILAFRDGYHATAFQDSIAVGKLQLLVLDRTGIDAQGHLTLDDRVFVQRDPGVDYNTKYVYGAGPTSVSVSAADLDGDGRDEVAVGYNAVFQQDGMYWQHHLLTYKQVPPWAEGYAGCWDDRDPPNLIPCLQTRSGHWKSSSQKVPTFHSEKGPEARLVLDTGDLDMDGKVEIALARRTHPGEIEVRSFDAASGLSQRSLLSSTFDGADSVEEFWLAMGDINGDTLYANYTGQCYAEDLIYPSALLHAPPHWPDDEHNSAHADAEFKTAIQTETGEKSTSETGYGGSATFGIKFHEIGPSITYEFERSVAVEHEVLTATMQSVGATTCPPYSCDEDAYFAAVGYHSCPRWCYEYVDSKEGSPITTCIPRAAEECAVHKANIDYWYGTLLTRPGWVPVGRNLARGRPAEQSSTNYGGVASRAVDGNTDGVYDNGSVTFAEEGPQPWWQADLGIAATVHAVQLWNRTDAAPERLSDFYVFLSEQPFSSDDPKALAKDREVWHYYHDGAADRLVTAAWSDFRDYRDGAPERSSDLTGRHVRVQLAGTDPLSLAEVQVWGMPAEVDGWPTDKPAPKDDSFEITLPDGSQQVVAGEHVYSWQGAKLGVDPGGAATWSTGQDTKWEEAEEWSTATTAKVGMEIRSFGGDYVETSKETKSRIMAWSKETEFGGTVGPVHAEDDSYTYAPYIWLQRAQTGDGTEQAFLVLDYWVPSVGEAAQAAGDAEAGAAAGAAPQAPLVDSPTHADPGAWYEEGTGTFAWDQPAGDPAVVTGYRWHLDRLSGTIPSPFSQGLSKTQTYQNLGDGVWVLHVRAQGDDEQWSETAHRAIRIDATPPEVGPALEPALPSGHNGWYNTPVSVTASAEDGLGSGVTNLEVSTDGVAWQPYAAPLTFDADTAGTTIWTRAADAAGHLSDPVSTTFKIDLTSPSSKTPGGPMPGALFAGIVLDPMGNEQPVLAGAIDGALSGQSGMDLQANGFDWTSATELGSWHPFPGQPGVEVTWFYTGTLELGRGNHVFHGRAHDRAGNGEAPYELARLVWFPKSAPELEGSSVVANPQTARPGDELLFTIAVRNSGYQEAWVEVVDTLPEGLQPVTERLARDVVYDAGSRTLAWPPRLLWPGQWHRHQFRARVEDGWGAGALENQATLRSFWPNTDALPAADRQRFEDRERTLQMATTVAVDPGLPAGADATAPWAHLYVHSGQAATGREVEVGIVAPAGAQWMYLREWTLDSESGEWQVAQNSGWRAYQPASTWTLSPGAGVKYLGAWVADEAWNVSTLDEHSLAFTNLLSGGPVLADGQRHQYRFDLSRGDLALYNLVAHRGDPDLYVWNPRHGLRPNHAAEGAGLADVVGFRPHETGVHLFEVLARGDSEYQLLPALPAEVDLARLEAGRATGKPRPEHPLTVSDPLSAGAEVEAPGVDIHQRYLPMVFKGW